MSEVFLDIHKDVIEQCKSGNSRSQYQLYQLYSKAMFNVCIRIMGKWDEAEDILQESFTEAFLKLDTFRYESTFGAWLKRIVINRCLNALKKKKIDLIPTENIESFEGESVQNEADNDSNDVEIEYSVNKIHKAIELLPEGYRVVFNLYAMEGYDHTEISQIMNISEGTSKSQYMRAKNKLKDIIQKQLS